MLGSIAKNHGVSIPNVVLGWHLAIGNVVIPKSANPERLAQNWTALALELDGEEIAAINALDKGAAGRIGPDPAVADFA